MSMIREGQPHKFPAAGGSLDVASASQFDTLGGTLFLTFRAGVATRMLADVVPPNGAAALKTVEYGLVTYQVKLGSNVVAEGGVQPISEELPVLWQGEIGPGTLGFEVTAAAGDVGAIVIADITAS